MVMSKNSRFGTVKREHFKETDVITQEEIDRISNKPFWPLAVMYSKKDVDILWECAHKIEEQYNEHGFSITDPKCHGLADLTNKYFIGSLKPGILKTLPRHIYDKYKQCKIGGVVQVFHINKGQKEVQVGDITSLYPFVMIGEGKMYAVGDWEDLDDVPVSEFDRLFGLIRCLMDDRKCKTPIGIPRKDKYKNNRYHGMV